MQSHSEGNASKVNKSIVNKSKSIEDRIDAFKNAIHTIKDIDKKDKDDFFNYWTEKISQVLNLEQSFNAHLI